MDRCIEANKYSQEFLLEEFGGSGLEDWEIRDLRDYEAKNPSIENEDQYYEARLKRIIKEATKLCNKQGIY